MLTLLLWAFLALGCEQRKEESSTIEPKCISSQSACVIKSVSGDFSILFNRESIITENPFEITLISDSKYIIKNISAHIEGKNMFMGKIPLFFEYLPNENKKQESNISRVNVEQSELIESNDINQNKMYVANTMLGSCSEEHMRWIIYFTVSLTTTQGKIKTENFNIEFNSFRG